MCCILRTPALPASGAPFKIRMDDDGLEVEAAEVVVDMPYEECGG